MGDMRLEELDHGKRLEETKLAHPTVGPAQLKTLSQVLAGPQCC